MDNKSAKKAIILFIVWVVSGVTLTIFNKFEAQGLTTIENSLSLIVTLVATAIYFIPMLVVINRQAKLASLKWLVVLTRILFIYFCFVFVVFLIILLCAQFI